MARLKDIADQTGLSVNTVSLALRGSPRISRETRDKVSQAAEALDYTPNHAAKALVSRRTKAIGLLLTDITSPLLTVVARYVERELKARDYVTLLAASNGDPDEETRALTMFRNRQVDGVLAYPNDHRELGVLRRLRGAGMPVVLLAGDGAGEIDAVVVDEHSGTFQATQHLISIGHRCIGLINGARLHGNPAKADGYVAALQQSGIEPVPDLVVEPRSDSLEHGYDAVGRLMAQPRPPTAVLAANDRIALGALHWCRVHQVAVPHSLAICGFDNVDYAAYASTPLSSVVYPAEDLARQGVARLIELMTSLERLPGPKRISIEPSVVFRESTTGGKGY